MVKINCDLCGKVDENLLRALIESVELNVCSNCSTFGKVIAPVKRQVNETKKSIKKEEPEEEKLELIVEDYAAIIRKKRESMGLTQKDFASRLNEKESRVHKIESGIWQPNIALAKKLEKVLGIKLVEEHLEKHSAAKKGQNEGFTIGDFIKIKN